jgi:Bacterial regulatory proteins, gntR family
MQDSTSNNRSSPEVSGVQSDSASPFSSNATETTVTATQSSRGSSRGAKRKARESANDRLSYKFQRLRERLREAISSGSLSGKLPGERTLARRFHVNAKTLSKALTDLAAEGLLHRTVGRGTFVRQTIDPSVPTVSAVESLDILVVAPADETSHQLVDAFVRRSGELTALAASPDQIGTDQPRIGLTIVDDLRALRPSFLSKFSAFVDIGSVTPEAILRDVLLRGLKVILIDRLPRPFVCHAVLFEHVLPAVFLLKRLVGLGHHQITLAFSEHNTEALDSIRWTASTIMPSLQLNVVPVGSVSPEQVIAGNLKSAIIFDDFLNASAFNRALADAGVQVPDQISVGSVGLGCTAAPEGDTTPDREVSGYAVRPGQVVDAIIELAKTPMPVRPLPVWLVSTFCDRGTIGPAK